MSDQQETPTLPPAGWYPDPEQAQTQRYWTGSQWTEQRAPLATSAGKGRSPRNDSLVSAGWICAVLFPIVGVVMGIVLMSREDPRGWQVALGSLAFGILWIAIVSALGY